MSKFQYLSDQKIIKHLHSKLSGIRSGRINASILDSIVVSTYGSQMKIVELATITNPEPAQLIITPFDKGVLKDIQKAITDSNLGVNPSDNGVGLILNFPPLTEEKRKNLVKVAHKIQEEARTELRQHRQKVKKSFEKQKEAGEISEDDLNRFETELQKEVESVNKQIEELIKNKEADLMKV